MCGIPWEQGTARKTIEFSALLAGKGLNRLEFELRQIRNCDAFRAEIDRTDNRKTREKKQ